MITLNDLIAICPRTNEAKLSLYVEPLNEAMEEFDISSNVERETHFLAQVAHESGGFRYAQEIASGEDYEGRKDLGNTEPGDGVRFKGRGLIQLTGRANYRACGDDLGVDLVSQPELLESPVLAARSAAWYWYSRHLNELADRGDTLAITKRINGGLRGIQERMAYLKAAQQRLA